MDKTITEAKKFLISGVVKVVVVIKIKGTKPLLFSNPDILMHFVEMEFLKTS
jgi:hypothetical protein